MELCTYNGLVPQGFPTSPILANFFRYDIDNKLFVLASENDLLYFNYGDDLIFAGNKLPPESWSFIDKVTEILQEYDLSINRRKSKILWPSRQQKILGIIVKRKPNNP